MRLQGGACFVQWWWTWSNVSTCHLFCPAISLGNLAWPRLLQSTHQRCDRRTFAKRFATKTGAAQATLAGVPRVDDLTFVTSLWHILAIYVIYLRCMVSHGLVDFQAFLVIVRSFLARGCGLWVVGPSSTRCGTPLCGTMEPCQALATCESSLCSAYSRLTNWIVFLYYSFVCVCDSEGKSFDMMCKWMCVYF